MRRGGGRLAVQYALPFAAGLVTLVLVTAIRVWLTPFIGESASLLPFVLPVVVAALLGGFTPAGVLIIVSLLTANWFVMRPVRSFEVQDPDELIRSVLFIVVGIGIGILGERQTRSERRLIRTTERLRLSEERSRRILDGLFAFAGLMTPDGILIEANRAALEAAGIKAGDVIDKPFADTYWWSWSPEVQQQLRDAIERAAGGESVRYDVEIRVAEGRPMIIDFMIAPIFDDHGRITHLVPSAIDITARMTFEHQLRVAKEDAEAANAAKDEFLMVVSHELRTPMTSLLGWVQMLMMGHIDAKETAAAVERIYESAVAEVEIIENILDVARLAVGKFVTRRERVDVSGIAEAALAQFQARAAERIITLDGEVSPGVLVTGDSDRLRQVVNNLLSNALKFTEPGGHVSLAVSNGDGKVRIEVCDDGIGIAPEFLAHVFDRFRQADEARSRRYGGLGLGLAIAKHLVEAHGGSIRAASDGAGRGARFVVELPSLSHA